MKIDTSSVIEKIAYMDDNPLEYDDLVTAWNTLCEKSFSDSHFAEIENAAILALSGDSDTKRS